MGKIIGGIVVVVVLVTGLFVWMNRGAKAPTTPAPGSGETGAMVPKSVPPAPSEDKGMIASLKDAMGMGKRLQCTYNMNEGGTNFQSTTVIEGQRFKSITVMSDATYYGLFDGTTQYTWTNKDKKGFKMSKACMDELKAMMPSAEDMKDKTVPKVDDLQASLDAAKNVSCQPTTEADFSVPSDITFTDQCALMKQSFEALKNIKTQLPSGFKLPEGMPSPY